MPYLMLIMEDPDMRRSRRPDEGRRDRERMSQFADTLRARGVLQICESLTSDVRGARIQVRGGKRSVVDGPFAESKEIVGGFFLLDCRTREEAVAIASECPATEWATVEVRELGPCWEGNE